MDPESRRQVMDACAIRTTSGWATHFTLMMVLSVVIAVMGLSANSSALVIGAMLIAPLMTPVLGTAAALTMALGGHLRRSLIVLNLASLGAIALAWTISSFVRDDPLTTEVIARTSPDGRDLMVALAAGAAGAYAVSRPDLSNSLPGVAIAVALVPPLATVGMTLEAGQPSLAGGALLLYVTNLSAIVVAGIIVFVVTGFAPGRRLATKARRVAAGTVAAVGLLIGVAIPLTLTSLGAADNARERQAVEEAVREWLVGTGDEVEDIDLDGHELTVRVIGATEPPPTSDLEQRIRAILSPDAVVAVGWTQEQLIRATSDEPTPEDLLDDDIRRVIDAWLTAGGVTAYDLMRLDISSASIRVDITSAEAPPTINELVRRLHDELAFDPELEVNWTPRTPVPSNDGASISDIEASLARVVREWAPSHDTEALRVAFDGATVTIDLAGTDRPDGRELEQLLEQTLAEAGIDPDDITIQVWFSAREPVIPAPPPTSTSPPAPTTTSAPSAAPGPTGDPTPTSAPS